MEAQLGVNATFDPPEPPGDGWRLVAAFWMGEDHAGKVLGDAVAPGGLLAALTSGPVEGALWSDGRTLRLTARAVAAR